METKTGNIKFHLCNVSETNDADLNCVFFLVQSGVRMSPPYGSINTLIGPGEISHLLSLGKC